MRTRGIFILTVFCVLASCSSGPQAPAETRMQKALDAGIRKYGVKGASAAVVFPDGKVWTGTSGFSLDSVSMKPDMLFAVGSVTKNMVAALVLQLVEENVLSLDDPVSKWLPPYAHVNGAITIRQLLGHTSGLYMFWDNEKIWEDLKKDRTKVWTPEEVLGYIREPYFEPGTGFRYSNTNYLLLAMIIENATGSKLATEFQNRFWKPLGFRDVTLAIQQPLPENLAHVFGDNFENNGEIRDLTFLPRSSHDSITFGSSGLFMTAEDLARWCQALFEGRVVGARSLEEMLKFNRMRRVANISAYGLGVQRYIRKIGGGETAIGHAGGNIGTITYMVYLPERHISITVMVNDYNARCNEQIVAKIIEIARRETGETEG